MSELKVELIDIEKIKPNPLQPRESFSKEEIERMAEPVEKAKRLAGVYKLTGFDPVKVISMLVAIEDRLTGRRPMNSGIRGQVFVLLRRNRLIVL